MITPPKGYKSPSAQDMAKLPEGTLYYSGGEWVECLWINDDNSGADPSWYCIPDNQTITLSDPKQAHGEKKPQLHLIPLAAQEEMARALELGASKYGERNWLLGDGVNITTYLSAMARHLALITDGKEDIDPESGAHHLGHIMAGCGIILDAMRHGKLIDNRVKPKSDKSFAESLMSTANPNPECGCKVCNPDAWWMVVCDKCGNKRCPRATYHKYECTNSNEVDQTPVLAKP